MPHEVREIKRSLFHSKIAVFAIVAFLALLTFLLIIVSQELTNQQASVESQASGSFAYNYARMTARLNQESETNQDAINTGNEISIEANNKCRSNLSTMNGPCYKIEGRSGGTFGPGCCYIKITCQSFKKGYTMQNVVDELHSAFPALYCDASSNENEKTCGNASTSCPAFGDVLKPILERYCAQLGKDYCSEPSTSPSPTTSPTPTPEITTPPSQSCCGFSKATASGIVGPGLYQTCSYQCNNSTDEKYVYTNQVCRPETGNQCSGSFTQQQCENYAKWACCFSSPLHACP